MFADFHRTYLLSEPFAEHEIWDPFSKLHRCQQKAMGLWWKLRDSKAVSARSAGTRASTCTGTVAFWLHLNHRKNHKRSEKQVNKYMFRCSHPWPNWQSQSIQPVSSMGAWSGAASCNQQIHRRMLERHSMQHGASISKYLAYPGIITMRISKHNYGW